MNRLPICAMLICTLLVLTLCSCQPERPSAPSDREVAFEYQNHPDLLSDDLDTRFQQLFYYELDQPTVEEPVSACALQLARAVIRRKRRKRTACPTV